MQQLNDRNITHDNLLDNKDADNYTIANSTINGTMDEINDTTNTNTNTTNYPNFNVTYNELNNTVANDM